MANCKECGEPFVYCECDKPKSNKRVYALRERRALLGLKRVEYALTNKEKVEVDYFIKQMRLAPAQVLDTFTGRIY